MTTYMHSPSAGGIVIDNGKVLLISSALRHTVDFPKGTIEPRESVEDAAIREVSEETGYAVRIMKDIGSITYDIVTENGDKHRKTVSYFLMELANNAEPRQRLQTGEDFVVEWVNMQDVSSRLTFPNVKELYESTLSAINNHDIRK